MREAMYFCTACPSGGIGAFGGLITKGEARPTWRWPTCRFRIQHIDVGLLSFPALSFSLTSGQTILMQMPTGAIGILTLMSVSGSPTATRPGGSSSC
jgi:hypothetical protein